jgi:hypothetical protein
MERGAEFLDPACAGQPDLVVGQVQLLDTRELGRVGEVVEPGVADELLRQV